jgi:hypothetical protein
MGGKFSGELRALPAESAFPFELRSPEKQLQISPLALR